MFLSRTKAAGVCSLLILSPGRRWCVQGLQSHAKLMTRTCGLPVQPLLRCTGLGPKVGTIRVLSDQLKQPSAYSRADLGKNILIYRNDNFRFFRLVGVFALAQLGFWSYLTYSAQTSMTDSRNLELVKYGPDGAPSDQKNWTTLSGIGMKLHSGVWRYVLTALCIAVGGGIFLGAITYSRKCIHRIVLRKGGDRVTFSTFGFFGQPWSFTVPVANVSCQHSRHGVRTQLPMKVKGHRLFYLLDKEGKMYNAPLFDQTVGMRRMLL